MFATIFLKLNLDGKKTIWKKKLDKYSPDNVRAEDEQSKDIQNYFLFSFK